MCVPMPAVCPTTGPDICTTANTPRPPFLRDCRDTCRPLSCAAHCSLFRRSDAHCTLQLKNTVNRARVINVCSCVQPAGSCLDRDGKGWPLRCRLQAVRRRRRRARHTRMLVAARLSKCQAAALNPDEAQGFSTTLMPPSSRASKLWILFYRGSFDQQVRPRGPAPP